MLFWQTASSPDKPLNADCHVSMTNYTSAKEQVMLRHFKVCRKNVCFESQSCTWLHDCHVHECYLSLIKWGKVSFGQLNFMNDHDSKCLSTLQCTSMSFAKCTSLNSFQCVLYFNAYCHIHIANSFAMPILVTWHAWAGYEVNLFSRWQMAQC